MIGTIFHDLDHDRNRDHKSFAIAASEPVITRESKAV